jgi:hypothetical protein
MPVKWRTVLTVTGLLIGSCLCLGPGSGEVGSGFSRKSLSVFFRPICTKESGIVKPEIAVAKSLFVFSPENVQVDKESAGPETQFVRCDQYPNAFVGFNFASARTFSGSLNGVPGWDCNGYEKWKWNLARIVSRRIWRTGIGTFPNL